MLRELWGELWDMNIMYKTRTKDEVTTGAVRDVEEGAADYGVRGRMTRQNFGSPCSPSCFCSLCQGKKGGGRHERGAAKRG